MLQVGQYRGLMDCFLQVLHEEGLHGFFKGYVPSLVKAGAATGVYFCVYEQTCRLIRLWETTQTETLQEPREW